MNATHICTAAVKTTAVRTFLSHTSDLIFVKDRNSVYIDASEPFVRMTGHASLDSIIGRTDFEIFENQELAKRYVEDDRKLLSEGNDLINYIEPLTDDRNHPRYSSTSKHILRDDNGEVIGLLGISRDITKEYITQQRYQQELRYLFELPDDTYATLFMDIEAWRIIRHRRQESGSCVLSIQETMEEFAANALGCLADPADEATRNFYQELSRHSMLELCNRGVRHHALKYLRRMPNGDTVWVRVDINFLIDPETGHLCAIWTLKNINNAVQDTITLRQAAERDEMTGLLNRAYTMKNIQRIFDQEPNKMHALFALDVDRFKSLNDTMGHQAGDQFLIAFAKMLKGCFRDSDVVGRVGGDEFFVLMKSVPDKQVVAEKANSVLNLSRTLCGTYPVEGLSASIGISLFPTDGTSITDLYAKADEALYRAKQSGKNKSCFSEQD